MSYVEKFAKIGHNCIEEFFIITDNLNDYDDENDCGVVKIPLTEEQQNFINENNIPLNQDISKGFFENNHCGIARNFEGNLVIAKQGNRGGCSVDFPSLSYEEIKNSKFYNESLDEYKDDIEELNDKLFDFIFDYYDNNISPLIKYLKDLYNNNKLIITTSDLYGSYDEYEDFDYNKLYLPFNSSDELLTFENNGIEYIKQTDSDVIKYYQHWINKLLNIK